MDFLKRHQFWLIVAALTLASLATLFGLWLPTRRANEKLEGDLIQGRQYMEGWLTPKRRKELPNEKIIQAYQEYKDYLLSQLEDALDYLAQRDKTLERLLPGERQAMRDGRVSPLIFKGAYVTAARVLRRRLARYGADRLLTEERWETSADELPDPIQFEWLRKRLWIWIDLAWVIETVRLGKGAVQKLEVQQFETPPDVVKINNKPLYQTADVKLSVQIPFYRVGKFIELLLYPRHKKRGRMSVRIKAMHIEKVVVDPNAATTAGGEPVVQLTLELEYLDFNAGSSL